MILLCNFCNQVSGKLRIMCWELIFIFSCMYLSWLTIHFYGSSKTISCKIVDKLAHFCTIYISSFFVQVQGEEMGCKKDAWVRWNALIPFSNCDCSSNRYWSARRNWSINICCCIGFGMRCMYLVNRSFTFFLVGMHDHERLLLKTSYMRNVCKDELGIYVYSFGC